MQNEIDAQTQLLEKKSELSDAKRQLLARRLSGGGAKAKDDRIQPRAEGAKVPLSSEQRLIWLHASQQPDVAIYNEPFTIYKQGGFALTTLARSLEEVVQRHEILRTSFSEEGEPIVHDRATVDLPFVDLSSLDAADREAEALRIATEQAQVPIALGTVPLLRAHVVRVSTAEDRLYLTFHHIIFDAVSVFKIFLPELSSIYNAFEQGTNPHLPTPLLQYGDYAIWRETQANPVALKRSLGFWKDQLSGELPVLHLPADRPEPAVASLRGSMECFEIPGPLADDLRRLSHSEGVTLYTILLAAYQVLLFRYGGQNDLIVGSACDSRRRPELDGVLGCFVDTFAVRTHPTADLSFSEYLKLTQASVLGGITAAEVPFDVVVREINPKRDANRHPIFQGFFSMRPPIPRMPAGWGLAQMDVTVGSSKFILYLELCERQDKIEGRFFYSTDLWNRSTIERMVAHWLTLLQSACRTPNGTLGTLAMLTPAENTSLLGAGGWNDNTASYPHSTVLTLIEQQMRRTPKSLAATFEEQSWTYEQLDARAEILALSLADAGVTAGSIVALFLNRSLDLLAGLIAIWKVGAAYLPFDIQLPPENLSRCLADAQPSAILTQSSLLSRLDHTDIRLVLTDPKNQAQPIPPAMVEQVARKQPGQGELEELAYIIYTSGTTGEPKGVEISHRSLVNFLTSMQTAPGFGSEDVLLAVTPISFDIATLEMFLPLISGGSLVIAAREQARDPQLLAEAIHLSKCTTIQATPATWRALLLSGWKDGKLQSAAGTSKRIKILCGGEALPRKLANDLLATGVELWNMYGPTETTIWSLIDRIEEEPSPICAGRPIANTTAFILDAQFQPLPVGVPGELLIGGVGLAKGYRGRREQTADRFVTLDFLPGERLYRTGDLAVRRENGKIEIQGRTDHQVKVRGFRVELEAVESALLAYPHVAGAAARVWPEATGNMRLSAYVVPRDGNALSTEDLRSFLERKVPEYMIPSDLIAIEQIPLTPHGKVDRNRLPAPQHDQRPQSDTESSGPTEIQLLEIWATLLGDRVIGVHDNFFDLGGHSLLVAALQHSIQRAFNRTVTMAELFYNPTIRQQARLLDKLDTSLRSLPEGMYSLQPEGKSPSLFWVHDLNGNLSKVIGTDHPFYSIELTTKDLKSLGQSPDLHSIAACHIEKILATQAQGPYTLGGLCAWGILSYEIAAQLKAAGHEVPLVILLDAPNPQYVSSFDFLKRNFVLFKYLLGRSTRIGPRTSLVKIGNRLGKLFGGWIPKPAAPKTEMKISQETVEGAALKYRPAEYEGNVLLILATDRPPHLDFLAGWQTVVKSTLHTRYVNAHHRDLLDRQNAVHVANYINSYINLDTAS